MDFTLNKVIDTDFIVPSDVFELNSGDIVPCDGIIIEGCCSVNESDLTGESNLIMKWSIVLNSNNFKFSNNKKSFLYFGSEVVKCESTLDDGQIRVVAINTGYNTRRGDLVQNLLFPRPCNFNIFKEVRYLLIFTFIIFLCNAVYLLYLMKIFNKDYFAKPENKICNPVKDPPDRSKSLVKCFRVL